MATTESLASSEMPFEHALLSKAELFESFAPLVNRLIMQYGSCPQLREELSGEIYHRFQGLVDAFDPARGVPLRPYLVRQLSSSVYTFVRSYRRSAARETPIDAIDTIRNEFNIDPTSEWDAQLMLEAAGNSIRVALTQLSERQRNVVIWRYYDDYSFEDIALMLDIQPATARSLLRHGLNRMKHFLTDFEAVIG